MRNQTTSKRNQFRPINLLSALFISAVLISILFFFVSPVSISSSPSPSISRTKLVTLAESGTQGVIPKCGKDLVDYMPCEDPKRNSRISREMNFYRERHCPVAEESVLCLVPEPVGYKVPVRWPDSLNKIWHSNMPHNKIADRKGHQGWMRSEGEYFIFPGGGTMFPDGAIHYIQKLKQYVPIGGGVLRTALDMGCGVASFGGYLLKENMLTLSFAPRDSHKSQIQFALERGVPAFVAMLGTRRLPFPAFSFDLLHCSRCLIPFTAYNASYFLEVDRLLRPGGYIVISGPPVKWHKQEKEWADLQTVAKELCYELLAVDGNTAIWKKRSDDSCPWHQKKFGLELCNESDDPSYAWYHKLKKCVSRISSVKGDTAVGTIPKWPERLMKAPSRAKLLENGIDLFDADTNLWARRTNYYKDSLNLKLGTPSIRNVMDMNAFIGGFAAAISSDPVWVMNVVPASKFSTLGVIYDRGLIGLYHDWCEPFSTYPRTYDLIHVAAIDSLTKDDSGNSRCNLVDLMVEIDRILRPEGTVVIRDSPEEIENVGRIARAIQWSISIHDKEPGSNSREKILVATKSFWKSS